MEELDEQSKRLKAFLNRLPTVETDVENHLVSLKTLASQAGPISSSNGSLTSSEDGIFELTTSALTIDQVRYYLVMEGYLAQAMINGEIVKAPEPKRNVNLEQARKQLLGRLTKLQLDPNGHFQYFDQVFGSGKAAWRQQAERQLTDDIKALLLEKDTFADLHLIDVLDQVLRGCVVAQHHDPQAVDARGESLVQDLGRSRVPLAERSHQRIVRTPLPRSHAQHGTARSTDGNRARLWRTVRAYAPVGYST